VRKLVHYGAQPLIMLILLMMFAGCAATPAATPTTGTVVEEGIVTEHTASDFTLLAHRGRLVLKFDNNTVTHSIDLNLQKTVTGPLNANAFYLGEQVQVEFYPTNNLAVTVLFEPSEKTSYTDLLSGAITEATPSYLYLNTTYVGLPRTLRISYDSQKVIIIRSDGSTGNVNDLSSGMNIRAFCGGSFTAYLIEIR
jgi:hypothetical protein